MTSLGSKLVSGGQSSLATSVEVVSGGIPSEDEMAAIMAAVAALGNRPGCASLDAQPTHGPSSGSGNDDRSWRFADRWW